MTAPAEQMVPASPFRDHIGLRIVELAPARAVVALDVTPPLMNYVGRLNGGVVASMVDMAGTLAGCHPGDDGPLRTAVTLTFTVSFLGTATAGAVRAVGSVRGGGRKVYSAHVDVFDAGGALIAIGQGTYQYMTQGAGA